ncbi:MAG: type II secretion system F family protein [Candidatus Brocadiia bacterium]
MSKLYRYSARDSGGKSVNGTMKANTDAEVGNALRQKGLSPMTIQVERGEGGGFFGPGKVKASELMIFTRQFATMISAGIPVFECISILQVQSTDKNFRKILTKVSEKVRSGGDLSDAMRDYPNAFPRIYVNMIAAGEASGQLEEILLRLSEFIEKSEKIKREVKGALVYPVVSLTLVFGITIFLLIGIVPKFKEIFDTIDIPLPFITKFVLGISTLLTAYWMYCIGSLVVCIVALMMYRKTEQGAYNWDWAMMKMPVFGTLFHKVALSRFARTFATLLRSGVPILGALEIVSGTVGNKVIEEVVMSARQAVSEGEPLAKTLEKSPVFPHMLVRMVEIGERSGALEALLLKLSDFYDEQVSATVEGLTALIEPLMIAVMGFVVGGIVLAIFMPIMKLQSALSQG